LGQITHNFQRVLFWESVLCLRVCTLADTGDAGGNHTLLTNMDCVHPHVVVSLTRLPVAARTRTRVWLALQRGSPAMQTHAQWCVHPVSVVVLDPDNDCVVSPWCWVFTRIFAWGSRAPRSSFYYIAVLVCCGAYTPLGRSHTREGYTLLHGGYGDCVCACSRTVRVVSRTQHTRNPPCLYVLFLLLGRMSLHTTTAHPTHS
jgi:hypothetical protein